MGDVGELRNVIIKRFAATVDETIEKEGETVGAAFRTWWKLDTIARCGAFAYQSNPGSKKIFREYFGEVWRDFSTSIYLALAGSYKNAKQTLRNCLELTWEMILKLREREFIEADSFSKKVDDNRDIFEWADFADSLIKWYHGLSAATHGETGEMDFPEVWDWLERWDGVEGDRVSPPLATMIDGSERPRILGPRDMFVSVFHPGRFSEWFNTHWVTYKACLALVSKLFKDLWLHHSDLIPSKPIRDKLDKEMREQDVSSVSFSFVLPNMVPGRLIDFATIRSVYDSWITAPEGRLLSLDELGIDIDEFQKMFRVRPPRDRDSPADSPSISSPISGLLEMRIGKNKWYLL